MSVNDGTPDGAPQGTPAPAVVAQPATPAPDGEGWRNVEEIKRALAGQRELAKKVDAITDMLGKLGGQPATPAPAPPATDALAQKALDELGQFKRTMAFRDALDSATLDPADKKLIKRLFDAEKPEDPATWLATAMADLPARGTPAAGNGQATAPGQSAPGRAPDGALPTNPVDLQRMRPDVWRAMSPEDKKAAWKQAMPVSDVQRFFTIPPKKG